MKKKLGIIFGLLATASWASAGTAGECSSIRNSWTNLLNTTRLDGEAAIRSQTDSQLQQAIRISIDAQTALYTSQMIAALSSAGCNNPTIQVTPPAPPVAPPITPTPPIQNPSDPTPPMRPPTPSTPPTPEPPTPPNPPVVEPPVRVENPHIPTEPPVIEPPVRVENPGNPRVEPPIPNPDKPIEPPVCLEWEEGMRRDTHYCWRGECRIFPERIKPRRPK